MDPLTSTHQEPPEDPAKTVSRSVALRPKLWEKVDAKVLSEYGDNRSAYFRELVEANLAGEISAKGSSVIVDLARRFHPGLVPEIEAMVAGPEGERVNQVKLLVRLLETVATVLRVIENTDREQVREESPIQAEIRRHKLIDAALEAVTDHLVADGLLQKAAYITEQPSPLAQRRGPGRRGGEKS
jgi:hypothetical protein